MSKLRRQISYNASLSTWLVTSVCSRSECTQSTVLYGSTHAEEICGHDHTVNEIFDFLPWSTERRSRSRQPRPEPVPPPHALKIMKPWRPVQLSANFRRRSSTRSTSSFPLMSCSGWNSWRYVPVRTSSTTVGSKSTNTARGTCFPAPVSEKNVLKASSPPPMVLSLGIWPSGWIPCSRQNNSQQALPIWIPAWPMWIRMASRMAATGGGGFLLADRGLARAGEL